MSPITRIASFSGLTSALCLIVWIAPPAFDRVLAQAAPVVDFEITASQFKFEPARLEVIQGDHVRIRVHSDDRDHGFAITGLKVRKLIPASGQVVTIEFDAKEAGEFEIMCTEVCGDGHADMKGALVVATHAASAPSSESSPR